jgi:hypothetical protein
MRWTRRLAVAVGLAVAAVGIAVPLSLSGGNASAAPAELSVASVSALGHGHLPQALKADLRAAWQAPDGQRVAALQAVLKKALAGGYGVPVQHRAQRLQARLDAMNPALRADLQRAIDLPKDQRKAALEQIRQKVKDGVYGPRAHRDGRFLHRMRAHHLFG